MRNKENAFSFRIYRIKNWTNSSTASLLIQQNGRRMDYSKCEDGLILTVHSIRARLAVVPTCAREKSYLPSWKNTEITIKSSMSVMVRMISARSFAYESTWSLGYDTLI
jgi:hypothetical protein